MVSNRGSRPRSRGPSIEDVAGLAGVSAQTVSRVANEADNVRPATRERVLQAMDRLGYTPNRAARALRNGAFGSIGLIARTFARTGEALTTQSVVEAAEAEGYSVTLLAVREPEANGWRHAVQRLSHQAVDGLIIIRAEETTPESFLLPTGMPVSVSDSRFIGYYPDVGADQVQGTRDAVEHLLGLGHRTVHHLAGPADSEPAMTRNASWHRTLEGAGISPPAVWRGDWTAQSGYEAGREIVADASVTAVYVANDDMALGLLSAAHEAGRQIPEALSVVGFDDIDLSRFAHPPLTTVRQDFDRAGRELVRLVLQQVTEPGSIRYDERVLLPTTLVVRASTAPPPAR
ncbi:LacI family DNA-binding transcriptional regulator [Occultella kanbiaonis]|uniref:LacI family DNA-binding transcriptional regulator n=1 Tax=Occultella kanbiaonis TaxID=2675754 RepID=UPI0012B88186|nr:LacI family DNA-binding transcriptional regulator [Occultella kanbiaonis]